MDDYAQRAGRALPATPVQARAGGKAGAATGAND
jgi:hypothetical protein